MPRGDLYQELYKRLNKAQKQAVEAIEGPVMVIAGPGTGKTQILTLRIANILRKTDTDPRSILALTFTESGVVSMRKRLSEIIGDVAYAVDINTFHGFCNNIIKNYPEEFPRIIGSQNITEVEQIKIIEGLIKKLSLKELRPFGDKFYYVRAVLTNLNSLKREGVDHRTFLDIVKKREKAFPKIEGLRHEKGLHSGQIKGEYRELWKQVSKNKELSKIYTAYQKELSIKRLYDYNDMIMEVLCALRKSKDLLLILQERFQYLLVDEHQDTNNAQNRILELLSNFHPNPNIFIVGDEKQAIFRFQGASLENFAYFKKLYLAAKVIALEENYRSTQLILNSAHRLASVAGRTEELKAQAKGGEKIRLCAFRKSDAELAWIAADIAEKIARGIQPEEIAVLYHDNKDAFPVARALEKAGVPYVIESDQDIFEDIEIKKLMAILRAVCEFGSEATFIEAMHTDFLGVHPLDIYRIISKAGERGAKYAVFDIVSSRKLLEKLKIQSIPAIERFYNNVVAWAKSNKNKTLLDTFESIVRESGYLNHILNLPDPLAAVERTNAVFDEIKTIVGRKRNATLRDFFDYLATLREHNLLVKRNVASLIHHRARLMTAHRSKGQEFEYVYIANAFDGHWGNRKKSNVLPLFPEVFSLFETTNWAYNETDDERRLFYVALTRAKRGVTVTYASESENGRERLPSQFVEEIKSELIDTVQTEQFETKYASDPKAQFSEPRAPSITDAERKLVRELFTRYGFSVTHLNNYLKCPWKYFYVNLLRIPQAQTKHQMYGTAVHAALKNFFDALKGKKTANKNLLIESFARNLKKQPLSESDLAETAERGRVSLGGYYNTHKNDWRVDARTELVIDGVALAPNVVLTGKIDKLEFQKDGTTTVVDYKTSRPKSRGEIEGKTKNSSGDMKRQLVFYKLLLNRFEKGRYRMKLGVIDFVEPDDKGRYRREEFKIEEREICELESLVKNAANEILTASFWTKTCSKKDCEFCVLRKLLGK